MIEYKCKKCEKKFKVKEFVRLEITYEGRKCDSCGNEIKIDDKSVTI